MAQASVHDQLLAENAALHALLADASEILKYTAGLVDMHCGTCAMRLARECLVRIKEGDISGRQAA